MSHRLFIFSIVIYILAFLVTTVIHELGHALTSSALGGRPILHHVFVEHHGLEGGRRAAVSAAGPLVSLLQGIVLFVVLRYSGSIPTPARLLLLWLCIHGLVNFFGYLITTPFVPQGDLGRVASWLKVPGIGRWMMLVVGLATVTGLGLWAREPLLSFITTTSLPADSSASTHHILLTGIGPWLVGSMLIALVSWPAPHWISYLYPFFAGLFLIVTIRRIGNIVAPQPSTPTWVEQPLWPWLLALGAVVVVFRAVLQPGVRLGS
ncbi:MAG: hypothetical protein K0V04_02260 [Deltaproteobacteria bacterium]|nr:hypothetical protein [Deltaproteobacteria bacterium]